MPGDRAPVRGNGKASALRGEPFCFYKGSKEATVTKGSKCGPQGEEEV